MTNTSNTNHCLTLFFFLFISTVNSLTPDGLTLLALKSAITTDPFHSLSTWSPLSKTPCNWSHITCNSGNSYVTSISLSSLNLTGYIPSELGSILSLTHLDLSSNNLSGPLPVQLSNLVNLRGTLNLSYNRFSGEIPSSYGEFPVFLSLDLRFNNLSGKIPLVGSLLNQGPTAFEGNNLLCGFPLSELCKGESFGGGNGGNGNLSDITYPRSGGEKRNPSFRVWGGGEGGREGKRVFWVFLVCGVLVVGVCGGVCGAMWVVRVRGRIGKGSYKDGYWGDEEVQVQGQKGNFGFVVGDVKVIDEEEESWQGGQQKRKMMKKSKSLVVGRMEEEEEGQKGKFVVVDEEEEGGVEGWELEDLLRASAYVVGKSRSGIVYKVVVGGGGSGGKGGSVVPPTVVAVRRLSEAEDGTWRLKEFEAEMEAIGKVQHPNVVRLRAYYYAKDEKLLISDFIRNGSLYTALHGGPSNDLPPLSWASRLKIAQGAARGLMHIHECIPKKYVHGNIKSSKVLLDESLHPYISGFGINRLVSGASKSATPTLKRPSLNHPVIAGSKIFSPSSVAYLAPEVRSGGKLTQKCDVYSFGIVLMEILTGRLPDAGPDNDEKGLESQVRKVFKEERPLSEIIDPALVHEVYAKKQVLATFHIALSCTESEPELRPRMKTVSDTLDRIKLQ